MMRKEKLIEEIDKLVQEAIEYGWCYRDMSLPKDQVQKRKEDLSKMKYDLYDKIRGVKQNVS